MNKSQLLFLFGCIPARIFLAYIGTRLTPEQLPFFGIVLLGIGLGFLILYFNKFRMNAPESGIGVTWWHNLRLVHGLLYIAAAIYAFEQNSLVYIPLTIDVIFGLILFLIHHYF